MCQMGFSIRTIKINAPASLFAPSSIGYVQRTPPAGTWRAPQFLASVQNGTCSCLQAPRSFSAPMVAISDLPPADRSSSARLPPSSSLLQPAMTSRLLCSASRAAIGCASYLISRCFHLSSSSGASFAPSAAGRYRCRYMSFALPVSMASARLVEYLHVLCLLRPVQGSTSPMNATIVPS